MFKRILCPIDGSEPAERALDLAVMLAARDEAQLWVMHVAEPSLESDGAVAEFARAEGLDGPRQREMQWYDTLPNRSVAERGVALARTAARNASVALDMGEQLLESAGQRAGSAGKVQTVLSSGDPAEEILDHAGEKDVDLIVMGTRGRGHLASLMLGSVSHKVASRAGCACITVR